MKHIEKKGVYVDNLTGLPNFFAFINTDLPQVFGAAGSIITLDLMQFSLVNQEYGRDMGDLCLRELSRTIQKKIHHLKNSKIYRIGGDEFIIILSAVAVAEATRLVEKIKLSYNQTMTQYQIKNMVIHSFVFSYSQPLTVPEFFNLLFQETCNQKSNETDEQKNWAKLMIETFISRIKETISLFNDAYKLALTDDISELPNHRSAKIYLDQLVKDTKIGRGAFSVLFIDGDNLKKYNNISYQMGNNMIKELSIIIKNTLRKEDHVFRWLSGDEFLVILDEGSKDHFSEAERIRGAVESQTQKWQYPVTISIGLSSYPVDTKDVEDLIIKAEKANSYAKSLGKNRVISWTDLCQDP